MWSILQIPGMEMLQARGTFAVPRAKWMCRTGELKVSRLLLIKDYRLISILKLLLQKFGP